MINFNIGELIHFKTRAVIWILEVPPASITSGMFIEENRCYTAICLSRYKHQSYAKYYFYLEGKTYQLFDDQVRRLSKVNYG